MQWQKVTEKDFDTIPDKPGVYIIVVSCKNGRRIAVYTGQSKADGLRGRIPDHWYSSETNTPLRRAIAKYKAAFCVYYMTLPAAHVDGAERYIFDCYEPQFTERAPNVPAIRLELPPGVTKGHVNF